MHRCFLSADHWAASDLCLDREEAHHVRHVLRLGRGDHVLVFDGDGREAEAELIDDGGGLALLTDAVHVERGLQVTLVQAIPKGKRMDWIVEKATELGVAEIIPVITDRGVVRIKDRQREERRVRWERLALSAAKQCGTQWVPTIGSIGAYADVLRSLPEQDLLLLGALSDDAQPIRDVLARARTGDRIRRVAVVIGPEGDLTAGECLLARERGAVPVSFGELVLRVDTAAIFAASVLGYELDAR